MVLKAQKGFNRPNSLAQNFGALIPGRVYMAHGSFSYAFGGKWKIGSVKYFQQKWLWVFISLLNEGWIISFGQADVTLLQTYGLEQLPGSRALPDTKTFCPKHSLHRGKGELVTNIVPWLYNVERSLSVLWYKCDKGRKEVWTWKKVPTVSSPRPWPLPKGSPARCAWTVVPDSELSVQSAPEFPWKISERKHRALTRKIFGFSGLLSKTKNSLFDRKQPIECLPNMWSILVYI